MTPKIFAVEFYIGITGKQSFNGHFSIILVKLSVYYSMIPMNA